MEPIYTEDYKGLTIEIHQDEDAQNPYDEDSNFGHIITWHRRYNIGDKHHYDAPSDFFESMARQVDDEKVSKWYDNEKIDSDNFNERTEKLARENMVILPLYLLDHSGLSISTGGFNDPWDSGQVGYIYATRAEILKEYSVKKIDAKTHKKVIELLEGEIKTYDDYLTGNVYGFIVKDSEGKHLDSCWGFYGDYDGYILDEARSMADYHAERLKKEAAEYTLDLSRQWV